MRPRYDAVIVGGGHNGLVAAFYLARADHSVAVLERRGVVGGPAATVEYFPGYRSAITNSPGSPEPKIVTDMKLEEFVPEKLVLDLDRAGIGLRQPDRHSKDCRLAGAALSAPA